MPYSLTPDDIRALRQRAASLGVKPEELLATIGMETGGSYSPSQWGGKNGGYMGLIQFGGPERKQFGVNDKQSFSEQLGPVQDFLTKRRYKPGMGLDELYSTINAGSPGHAMASDRPGATVASHVADIRRDWVPRAQDILSQVPEGARPTSRTYDPLSSLAPGTNPFKAIASPDAYDPLSSIKAPGMPGSAGYRPPPPGTGPGTATAGGKGGKIGALMSMMGGAGGGAQDTPQPQQTPSVGNPLTRDPANMPMQSSPTPASDPNEQMAMIFRMLGVQ